MNNESPIEIGDRVASILPGTDAVGIVVDLLPALFEERVEETLEAIVTCVEDVVWRFEPLLS